MLIAYATGVGGSADDGNGSAGIYTAALMQAMRAPPRSAIETLEQASAAVRRTTGRKQVPEFVSALTLPVYLGLPSAMLAQGSPFALASGGGGTAERNRGIIPESGEARYELLFWESIKDSDNPDLYLAYLQRYPDGVFKVIAEARLKEIYSGGADDVMEDDTAPVVEPPVTEPPTTQVIVEPSDDTGGGGPATTKTIKGIQRQLARLGCYKGAIDGIWGPQSRLAAQRFNRRYSGFNISTDHPGTKGLERLRTVVGPVCR